jgi:hypothetical protein
VASTRKHFTLQAEKLGFKRYRPKGDIHRYSAREYIRRPPLAVGMSPKGSSVDVSVYQLEDKLCRHFDTYSEAWSFLVKLITQLENPAASSPHEPLKSKRRKG